MHDPITITQDERPDDRSSPLAPVSAAFISPGWPPNAFANGVIPYVANIAEEMRRAGHRAMIVAMNCKDYADENVYSTADDERSRSLVTRAGDSLAFRISAELGIRRLAGRSLVSICRRLIKEQGLQIVEMEEARGHARFLERGLPIPVVIRLHGPWFLNGPIQGAVDDAAFHRRIEAEKRAILGADLITAPSHDVLERTRAYYQLGLERAVVIPNPTYMVPLEDRWRPDACEPDTILFVGRFDRHKGGDLVIDAFAEVVKRRPEARLRFVGPDAGFTDDAGRPWRIEDYLLHKLPGAMDSSQVEWMGMQPAARIPSLRSKAAIVVVGSRYDNYPTTVLEASAKGCPLVAPRIGGVPEIIDDGVNGLLYRVGDSVDMASKLIQLLEDRDLAARLGHQGALDRERHHDPAVLARKTADMFRGVIEARGHLDRGRGPR